MTQYHIQDIAHNARKFPNVSQVSVKYHKNMIKIIIKQASLKIIVAILAKKLVLYCHCSLKAYFKNCKYFFIVIYYFLNVYVSFRRSVMTEKSVYIYWISHFVRNDWILLIKFFNYIFQWYIFYFDIFYVLVFK